MKSCDPVVSDTVSKVGDFICVGLGQVEAQTVENARPEAIRILAAIVLELLFAKLGPLSAHNRKLWLLGTAQPDHFVHIGNGPRHQLGILVLQRCNGL